jgi:hypothetical protein
MEVLKRQVWLEAVLRDEGWLGGSWKIIEQIITLSSEFSSIQVD